MNKFLMGLASLTLLLGLAACGGNNEDPSTTSNGHEENDVGMDTNKNQNGSNPDNGAMDDQNGNNVGDGNANNLEHDREIADRVATVKGVEGATVLLSANNAYVAVDLAEGTDETDELKTKISDEVKAAKPDTEKVYVSADPDFTKQFKDYGKRIEQGDPVEGFFDEFSDLIRRTFPDAK
ncbi:YhcN/YlaJ family sporulation lipoprotein [Bhargavaea beijingensis]|uniref:Sporulation lipoprotein, YhcN/YlaJ family n=1 Tax=Bhargavaea beijingensis TaxID=426756 RepID=A0A1G7FIX8_9BACL|nr:YhcN/YlaJ family sporulation lipoprotein [Bhargavaea beijingensis]RSK31019.1 YhcN/YlaJ family sporulation lipoprotein [Bhargavaea beijingensis]SDE75860.1 sporulation lipoprotein, YhcN/YlaJ family [Bhargavaea beijingensis]